MTEIDSSRWTGPLEDGHTARRKGIFTHRSGQHQYASDYDHLNDRQRIVALVPPEIRGVVRLGGALFILSPLVLWIAWFTMVAVSGDVILNDNRHILILWGVAAAGLGFWQLMSRSVRLIDLRKILLGIASVATLGLATAYVFAGARAHASAGASSPERTFEIRERRGGHRNSRTVILHQRADGTLVEGGMRSPLKFGQTCSLVQRLHGSYGFSWIRVVEQSRPPVRGGLNWGIAPQDCFGSIPMSSLPR